MAISAQQDAPVAFEVASVKPDTGPEGHSHVGQHGSSLEMTNVTLRSCITLAYGVADNQVVGPAWLDELRFDIVAKSPSGAPDESRALRLRTLLADRFKLAIHHETREGAVYELVVAKGGPKLEKDDSGTPGSNMASQRGQLSAGGVSMAQLADFLGSAKAPLDRPVVDKTGLSGRFNFTLKWGPDEIETARPEPNRAESNGQRADRPPPLIISIQEQLGLKLEPRKGPVPFLIVDHAEKVPTEN
jgi:uncharacterized protein (TIGR03435 family)